MEEYDQKHTTGIPGTKTLADQFRLTGPEDLLGLPEVSLRWN